MRVFGLLATVVVVSGCVDRNGVTVSGREFADDGTLVAETKEIERPFTSAVVGLASGSEACLNKIVEADKTTMVNGERRKVTQLARYSTAVGQNSQMFVMHLSEEIEIGNGEFGPKSEIMTVRAWAADGTTLVSLEGGDDTFRSLDVGILRMANGDSLICPRMPFEY